MKKPLIGLAVASGALALAGAPASAQPPHPSETGCAPGQEALEIEVLEALGYLHAPQRADEAGNADGVVCGVALPEGFLRGLLESADFVPTVEVVYQFFDNHRTPAH